MAFILQASNWVAVTKWVAGGGGWVSRVAGERGWVNGLQGLLGLKMSDVG